MDLEFIQIEGQQGGWQLLFQKLHQIARVNAGSQAIAKKPMNVIRNRYRDVLPIDSTRVKLDDPDSDYINANHVKLDEVNRKYILSQGPLEHTCPHFWQMIWENNSSGIVMLNKCVERGMNKCYPYWPHAEDPPLEMGKFRIENLGCDEETSYQLSHLKLENMETNESRVVMHYHYTKWPDFGVPQNPEIFLEFLYAVRGSGVLNDTVGPCVIHCSAGIGRTGTFCLVDILLTKLESTQNLASANLQSVLLTMRRQRLGLIQTPDQLRFSYIAVLQGAIQDLHLETSSYEGELSDSEEEEDSLDESDSDEEDENERMERKYPHLNRQYGTEGSQVHDVDDIPPPLPPRPPETLSRSPIPSDDDDSDDQYEKQVPPPPPPTSRPPGPPTTHRTSEENSEDEELQLTKKRKLDENEDDLFEGLEGDEEYGFKITQNLAHKDSTGFDEGTYENGEIEESESDEVLEESENEEVIEEEIEEPPPVPPRSHSLSPSPSQASYQDLYNGAGRVDIYGSNSSLENGSSSFLGEGRGGGKVSPPLGKNQTENGGDTTTPPPLPAKNGRRRTSFPPPKNLQDIEEEEKALISELDELERLVARDPTQTELEESGTRDVDVAMANGGIEQTALSPSDLRRRVEREARRDRIKNKVESIREQMKDNESEAESEWSVPWVLVGFVAVLGYCLFYVFR